MTTKKRSSPTSKVKPALSNRPPRLDSSTPKGTNVSMAYVWGDFSDLSSVRDWRKLPIMPNPYPPDDILGLLKLAGSTAGLAAPVFLLIKAWLDARAKRVIKLRKGDVEIELQGGISKKELERAFSQFRKLTQKLNEEEIKVIEKGKIATRDDKHKYLIKESDVEAARGITSDNTSKLLSKKKERKK